MMNSFAIPASSYKKKFEEKKNEKKTKVKVKFRLLRKTTLKKILG
jgi:hypothetical protein